MRRDDLVEAGGVSADDAATLEEEEQRRVEEEIALAERLSPGLVAHAVGSPGMSPGMEPTVIDQSPERTRSKFELPEDGDGETDDEDEEEHHHEPVEQTDVTMSMSPVRVDASVDKENNENNERLMEVMQMEAQCAATDRGLQKLRAQHKLFST